MVGKQGQGYLKDEYDTPMQEAYVNGYWNEMTGFIRNFREVSYGSVK